MNPRARSEGQERAFQKKLNDLFGKVSGYLDLYKQTKKKLREDPISKIVYEQSLKNIAKELKKAQALIDKLKYQGEITAKHEEKYKKIFRTLNAYRREFDHFLEEDFMDEEKNLPDIGLTPILPLNNPVLQNYDVNKGYEIIGAIGTGMDFDEVAKRTGVPIEVFIGWTLRISDFKRMFYNALYMRSWVLAERMKTLVDNCPDENNAVKKTKLQTDVYRFLISHYAPKEWGENEVLKQAMVTAQQEEAGVGGVQIILPSNGREVDEASLKEIPEHTEIIEVEEFGTVVSGTRSSDSLIELGDDIPNPGEYNVEEE